MFVSDSVLNKELFTTSNNDLLLFSIGRLSFQRLNLRRSWFCLVKNAFLFRLRDFFRLYIGGFVYVIFTSTNVMSVNCAIKICQCSANKISHQLYTLPIAVLSTLIWLIELERNDAKFVIGILNVFSIYCRLFHRMRTVEWVINY